MKGSHRGRRRIPMRDMRNERGFEVHSSRFQELRTQNFELWVASGRDCDAGRRFSIPLCGGWRRCPDERVHERIALKILQILN